MDSLYGQDVEGMEAQKGEGGRNMTKIGRVLEK